MFKGCEKHGSVPVKVQIEITVTKILGIPEKYYLLRFGLQRKRKYFSTPDFSVPGSHDVPETKIQYNCTLYATKPNAQAEVRQFCCCFSCKPAT